MAQLWSTGPALFYVGYPPAVGPFFLGTSANKPSIDIDHQYKGVPNDLAGGVPMDESYQGSQAFIRCDLGRWNEDVLRLVRSVPNAGGTPGLNPFGDMGALMLTEGYSAVLYIQFPYFSKTAYRNGVQGYRFPCVILERESHAIGTDARRVPLVWLARRGYDPVSMAFLLYDHTLTGLPSPN